jgi:hypothetical protein
MQDEGWVICRVFRKKLIHLHNNGLDDRDSNYSIMSSSSNDKLDNLNINNVLPGKSHFNTSIIHEKFTQLQSLKHATAASVPTHDWAALDKFVASQLNGTPADMHIDTFDDQSSNRGDDGLWSF